MEQDAASKAFFVDSHGHGLPTEWSLKLVPRFDGADGFSVVANSSNKGILYLVAVVGFCVEAEQSRYSITDPLVYDDNNQEISYLGRLQGARVDPDAGSKTALSIATGWHRHCLSNHDDCRPRQGPLPSRLLDLNAFDDPKRIRLCETQTITTADPYIALSHCWGDDTASQVKTTRATLPSHLKSLDIQTLSQSFQDAIKVTRHLGVQFLWIDSLCICQGDPDDWARESANMHQVYSGALLTIAADSAPGSTHGFLNRRERLHVPIQLKLTLENASRIDSTRSDVTEISAYAFDFPPSKTYTRRYLLDLIDEPLTSRAWAMQERLLSPRLLHFARGQLFYECNYHFLSEDGIEISGRWNSLIVGGDKTITERSKNSRTSSIHQLWYMILQDFTDRQLTAKTDWLPAISGQASLVREKISTQAALHGAVHGQQQIDYVAGLWSDALVEGLGWVATQQRGNHMAMPDERPLPGDKGYIAPTWSPASFYGFSFHGDNTDSWADVTVVTGFNVTPKNKQNLLGEVVDGWISLRAPMVKLTISRLPDDDTRTSAGCMRLSTPHGDQYGTTVEWDDNREETQELRSWVQNTEIFALFLSVDEHADSIPWYKALLIAPVSRLNVVRPGLEEFRRVGIGRFNTEDIGDDKNVIDNVDRFLEVVLV
jgi:hypothetical protein